MSLAARVPAPFPFPGSMAWLRPERGREQPIEVKILQHIAGTGEALVSQPGPVCFPLSATANRRVALSQLARTEAAARRRERRKPRRKSGADKATASATARPKRSARR